MLEFAVLLAAPLVLVALGIAVDVWNPVDRNLARVGKLFDQADAIEEADPSAAAYLREQANDAAKELERELDARRSGAPRRRVWTMAAGCTLIGLGAVLALLGAVGDVWAWRYLAGGVLYFLASYPYFHMARTARHDALDLHELRRRVGK